MSLNINTVSSEEEQNLEEVKEQLKDVNEKIGIVEKRLVAANRTLTYLYSSDKGLEASLASMDEDEREICERHVSSYGDVMDSLEAARTSHEHHVNLLRQQINSLMERHHKRRSYLKSNLLSLKLALAHTRKKKKIEEYEKEIDEALEKQAVVERDVIRLRTKQLQRSPNQKGSIGNGVRVIELRERQGRTEHQLGQMRTLLAQQSAEKQQLSHVEAQAASKNTMLELELRSLQSDKEMANLEYSDVCRQYCKAQREYQTLRARVEDAETDKLLGGLTNRHKEVIWRVITLDASTKREKQRCASLRETLYASKG